MARELRRLAPASLLHGTRARALLIGREVWWTTRRNWWPLPSIVLANAKVGRALLAAWALGPTLARSWQLLRLGRGLRLGSRQNWNVHLLGAVEARALTDRDIGWTFRARWLWMPFVLAVATLARQRLKGRAFGAAAHVRRPVRLRLRRIHRPRSLRCRVPLLAIAKLT